MKNFKSYLLAVLVAASLSSVSCKKEPKPEETATPSVVAEPVTPSVEPVTISPDDQLTTDVKDATKDYPEVTATVLNGEITLTGSITRDRLPNLMQSLHALHPKKINNNLTVNNK